MHLAETQGAAPQPPLGRVGLKVDERELIRNQRYAFTSRFVVIQELLQNSRRAGATRIDVTWDGATLGVADNGSGIEDFQDLLFIAKSGWPQDVAAEERPFGQGWLSCLFGWDVVDVQSGKQRLAFRTEDAIDGKEFDVTPCEYVAGTHVRLTATPQKDFDLSRDRIARIVRGFPIPVAFNGEEIERPHALDSGMGFEESAIGHAHIVGVMLEAPSGPTGERRCDQIFTSNTHLYLQGFSVGQIGGDWGAYHNIVHLDSRQFAARLPDRTTLIDADKAEKRIKPILKARFERAVLDALEKEDHAAVTERFEHGIDLWSAHHLLGKMNVLPKTWLTTVGDYPKLGYEGFPTEQPMEPLSRADIESGKVCLCEDIDSENIPAAMLVWKLELVLVRQALPPDHWARSYIKSLDECEPKVTPIKPAKKKALFRGCWVTADVVLCERYKLRMGKFEAEFSEDALAIRDKESSYEGVVYYPAGESSGQVVNQLSDYYADEHYEERDNDTDDNDFGNFVKALRIKSPETALRAVIESVVYGSPFKPMLRGKSFVVKFGSGKHFTVSVKQTPRQAKKKRAKS